MLGLFPAPLMTPAPWVLSVPSLPQASTFTIQGLIETGGGQIRVTNGITVSTYDDF